MLLNKSVNRTISFALLLSILVGVLSFVPLRLFAVDYYLASSASSSNEVSVSIKNSAAYNHSATSKYKQPRDEATKWLAGVKAYLKKGSDPTGDAITMSEAFSNALENSGKASSSVFDSTNTTMLIGDSNVQAGIAYVKEIKDYQVPGELSNLMKYTGMKKSDINSKLYAELKFDTSVVSGKTNKVKNTKIYLALAKTAFNYGLLKKDKPSLAKALKSAGYTGYKSKKGFPTKKMSKCLNTCYTNGASLASSGSGSPTVVNSDGKEEETNVLIDHGGKALNRKAIYGKMENFPATFDVDYVDVAIPYKLTCNQIGGQSASSSTKGFTGNNGKKKMGTQVTEFNDALVKTSWIEFKVLTKDTKYWNGGGKKGEKGAGSMNIFEDKNGVRYVATAIQCFFFSPKEKYPRLQGANNANGFKFKKASSGAQGLENGTLVDAIFKDGTVLHMIYVSNNAAGDTNGGTNRGGNLKLEQYANIYGGSANQIEIAGVPGKAASDFRKVTGISNSKPIMYYRIYNANINSVPKPVSNDVKAMMYTVDGNTINGSNSSGSENSSESASGSGVTGNSLGVGFLAETSFVSKNVMEEAVLEFIDSSDLTEDELYNVELWKSDIKENSKTNILINGGRWLIMLFGILFIIWMILIYMAFWFDTINNFVEIEMLPIITFGRLRRAESSEDCTWSVKDLVNKGEPKTINNKYLFIVVCIGCTVGALIVSGQLFVWVGNLIHFVLKQFSNI